MKEFWWHVSQRLAGRWKVVDPKGIDDLSLTCEPIRACNAYLRQSPRARKGLFILSSLALDLGMIGILGDFIVNGTWNYIVAYFLGLNLRLLSNLIVSLPSPEGVLWEDPGFPSLFVTYDVTSDYFFSGHTFASFLLQSWLASKCFGLLGWGVIGLEIATIVTTRSHYYMDIYAAITTVYSLKYALGM